MRRSYTSSLTISMSGLCLYQESSICLRNRSLDMLD
jgi:hypothetical protein